MMPTAAQVAAYLGRTGDTGTLDKVYEHLPVVAAFVSAYTRGQGFTAGVPADDLAAVIVSCCARSLDNPEQVAMTAIDDYTVRPGTFNGWTLPELAVLHNHRRRAA